MALPRTCTRNLFLPSFDGKEDRSRAGFTLIEILIVLGILAILSGFGLVASLDAYRGYSFRNERNTMVSVLQKARSQAISNICLGSGCTDGKPHGVAFQAGQYIIFQGSGYAARDQAVDQIVAVNYALTFAPGSLPEVVFSQLSGDAAPAGTITLTDEAGHSSVISINSEGQISWTN